MFKEEQVVLDEIIAKRQKKGKKVEEKPMEEKSTMHSKIIEIKNFFFLKLLL